MSHIHDNIDFCSEVYIVYKNKVLLRMHDKYDFWLSVGGHIELDEDPAQAAIREAKEEVGLDIELFYDISSEFDSERSKALPAPSFMNRHHISETHEHIGLIFFAKASTDELVLSKTEVSKGCRWFSMEDLEKDTEIMGQIKFYAIEALKRLSE